jgi:hypothetical protein
MPFTVSAKRVEHMPVQQALCSNLGRAQCRLPVLGLTPPTCTLANRATIIVRSAHAPAMDPISRRLPRGKLGPFLANYCCSTGCTVLREHVLGNSYLTSKVKAVHSRVSTRMSASVRNPVVTDSATQSNAVNTAGFCKQV